MRAIAFAAIARPVATEPVKLMRVDAAVVDHRLADDAAASHHQVEHARGQAGLDDDVGERPRASRARGRPA